MYNIYLFLKITIDKLGNYYWNYGWFPSGMGNLCRFFLSCYGSYGTLGCMLPKTSRLFIFPIFWLWTCLV